MPKAPRRPCAWPGCPELVEGRYCPTHAAKAAQIEEARRRPGAHARYGRRWRAVRDAYAAAHPLCERCLADGKAVQMDIVHHRVPTAQGGSDEADNLVSLCWSCHEQVEREIGSR